MIDQSDLVQLYEIQLQLYINVACITLWTYEYCVTLGSEISLIWKSGWSIPKVLFLLTRYLPFISLFITLILHVLPNLSTHACLVMDKFASWIIGITLLTSELILTIRTWIVYNRDLKMGVFLSTLVVVSFAANFTVEALFMETLVDIPPPLSLVPGGCYPSLRSNLYNVNYVIFLVFYGVLLVVFSIKSCKELFDTSDLGIFKKPLISIIYIDGMVYYIIFFLISLIGLILDFVPAGPGADQFPTLQIVISSILSCRMLFRLRDYGKRTAVGGTGLSVDTSVMAAFDVPLQFVNEGSDIEYSAAAYTG